MEALQAVTSGTSYVTVLQARGCDSRDGGRRASTSRLLLKNRRGVRIFTHKNRRSKQISCSAGSAAAGGRNSSAPHELGRADFVLTEKVFRLWRSQQPSPSRQSSSSWVPNVATSPKGDMWQSLDYDPAPKVEEEESSNGSSSQFDWKTNWYPVIPEMDLDKKVPYPFQVLGRKVVFWYDAEKWNCVLDSCPHRLAPLSEGRIDEQGCIQCSYHGWSFRGDGSCARIPQARKEGPEAKACEQSKSRAVVLPVVVKQGILFVWPDENSKDLASITEPPITPGIEEEGWCAVGTFRDLPYGYDTGMENLADPSHIPVAHHNVNGGIMGKRDQATFLDLEVKKSGPTGFEAEMKKVVGPPSIHTFHAPARFTYAFELRNISGARAATTTYCTPTSPGNCRIVVVNARNFMIGLSSGSNWWQLFPRWLDHQMMLNLLDGDATLLHGQERYLREKAGGEMEKWNKAYYMPTTADRYVGAFRQWLARFGGKGVQWAEGVDPTLPPLITKREDLLNRYTTHTKQCKVCSNALHNFELARKVLFVVAAALLGLGAVLGNPVSRLLAVGVAALAGLVGWYLGGWIQMFYYKGYDHARIP
ncbi:unnamed protein product [Calypogeia fissa]